MKNKWTKNSVLKKAFKNKRCFTLIELLIVIAIIGILASVITVATSSAINKAKIARATAELNHFKIVVQMAQLNTGKVLGQITGSWGTYFLGCPENTDLRNLPPSSPCAQSWQQGLAKIEIANGVPVGTYADLKTDPWGSPYMLDENEMEPSGPLVRGCAVHDLLFSVGPNGKLSNSSVEGEVDVLVPFLKCPEAGATDRFFDAL